MFQLRACFAVGVMALVACGDDNRNAADAAVDQQTIDAKVWMDAPPTTYDFSCMGNSAPTTGDANVTLSGTVTKVNISTNVTFDALPDATLKACKTGAANCTGPNQYGNTVMSSDVAGSEGTFSIGPISTGSAPLPAYIEMTEGSSRTIYTYPPSAFTGNQAGIPILTFAPSAVGALQFFGCSQNDTNNGMIGLAALDCSDTPMADTAYLTIEVKQNGSVVQGTSVVDLGSLPNASMAAGTFLICNVPENAATTVSATYNGMALREHDVKVVKGTTTATAIRPGY